MTCAAGRCAGSGCLVPVLWFWQSRLGTEGFRGEQNAHSQWVGREAVAACLAVALKHVSGQGRRGLPCYVTFLKIPTKTVTMKTAPAGDPGCGHSWQPVHTNPPRVMVTKTPGLLSERRQTVVIIGTR